MAESYVTTIPFASKKPHESPGADPKAPVLPTRPQDFPNWKDKPPPKKEPPPKKKDD